jgi:hypothetical protein
MNGDRQRAACDRLHLIEEFEPDQVSGFRSLPTTPGAIRVRDITRQCLVVLEAAALRR